MSSLLLLNKLYREESSLGPILGLERKGISIIIIDYWKLMFKTFGPIHEGTSVQWIRTLLAFLSIIYSELYFPLKPSFWLKKCFP